MSGPAEYRRRLLGARKGSSQSRVLEQWWGGHFLSLQEERDYRPREIRDLARMLGKRLRLEQRRQETEILAVWREALDPDIVRSAQPCGLAKGTLHVKVDSSPALAEIVRYRRKEILDRMQASYGQEKIQRISFRLG